MIRRAYVETAAGQLHLTEAGEGRPIVLLPWFPLSGGRFYGDELPVFAAAGWRAIAVDPMGQGRSARRDAGWTVERHADTIAEAMAALALESPVVLGGHMGAGIAIELASRPALAVSALVLDGGPFMPPEAVAALQARARYDPDPDAPSAVYDKAVTALSIFDPAFATDAAARPRIHRLMGDIIDADVPAASDTPPGYPAAERLAALAIPVLALTAETDPLRPAWQPALDFARDGRGHIFPGGHPLHDPARIGAYARGVIAMLEVA